MAVVMVRVSLLVVWASDGDAWFSAGSCRESAGRGCRCGRRGGGGEVWLHAQLREHDAETDVAIAQRIPASGRRCRRLLV